MDSYHEAFGSRHLVSNATPPANVDAWDASFNDFVDLGSPMAGRTQDTAPTTAAAAYTVGHPSRPSTSSVSTYGQWLAVPQAWDDSPPARHPGESSVPLENVHLGSRECEMQRQINELRDMVSSLVSEKRQMHPSSAGQDAQPVVEDNSHDPTRSPTPFNSNTFASFSFGPSSQQLVRPSDGYATPMEPMPAMFDQTDDSPIYSRRGSACSIGSATSKRGQRKPKGYACAICESRFDLPSDLRHHERKHLPKDERPHACDVCKDRFLYPKDVTRHKRQVHGITEVLQMPMANADEFSRINEEQQLLQETPRQRNRNWQQGHASRERRAQYIKELETTVRNLSHDSRTLDSRRDSAIADMGPDQTDHNAQSNNQTIDLERHLTDLREQLTAQQQDLLHLENFLQQAKEENTTLISERDAFSEIFSRTAVFPDFTEASAVYRPSTVEHARGWLGAIETLLSSAEPPADVHESQISEAMNLIMTALDNVHIQETAR